MTVMTDKVRIPMQTKPHGRNAAKEGHARDTEEVAKFQNRASRSQLIAELNDRSIPAHVSRVRLAKAANVLLKESDPELIAFVPPQADETDPIYDNWYDTDEPDEDTESCLILSPADLGMDDIHQLRRRTAFLDYTEDEKGDCPWFGFHVDRFAG